MKRVNVYVDGFNLYHALINLRDPSLRWLDVRRLTQIFIHPSEEQVSRILYCSAYATHLDEEKVQRHHVYVKALEATGVTFIQGKFKRKNFACPIPICDRREILKHEEKETDVNLSIHMVRDALLNDADRYILISNDTDLIPALRMIKKERPQAYLTVLTPPTYYPHKELWQITGQRKPRRILEEHIAASLFPETIKTPRGNMIIRPDKYAK